jgi:hypothetical protein
MGGSGERKRVLSWKKEPKNFCPFAGAGWEAEAQRGKVFLLLFLQKKKRLSYRRSWG